MKTYTYMVWAVLAHNLKRAFIEADTGFEARKKYAAAYSIPVSDCMSSKVQDD